MKLQRFLQQTAIIAITLGSAKAQVGASTGNINHRSNRGHRTARTTRAGSSNRRAITSNESGDRNYVYSDKQYGEYDPKSVNTTDNSTNNSYRLEENAMIRINLVNGTSKDQTLVYFNEGTTPDFDGTTDARKIGTPKFAIYTGVNDRLAINSVSFGPLKLMLPITMVVKSAGSYKLAIAQNTTSNESFFIWDKRANRYIDLYQGNEETVDLVTGVNENRFYLVNGNNNVVTGMESFDATTSNLGLYPNPYSEGSLSMTLDNSFGSSVNVEVIDANNNMIKSFATGSFVSGRNTKVDLSNNVQDLQAGNYFVRFTSGASLTMKKLVIVK